MKLTITRLITIGIQSQQQLMPLYDYLPNTDEVVNTIFNIYENEE
jgi:hypothetical protein